jgi:hypothetical protein
MFIALCFATRKDFLPYQSKKLLLPLISGFPPVSAASNYLLPPAGPRFLFQKQPGK